MPAKQKLAVISGASRGLGLEMSPYIESLGYTVIRLGLNSPGPVDFRCDLSNQIQAFSCVMEITENLGDIDLLICNAGTGKRPTNMQSEPLIAKYFNDTNFLTAKNLIEGALPSLRRTKGNIIAISSIVAIKDIPDAPVGYTIAKKMLNSYVKTVAKIEAHEGVRANIVSPGNLIFPKSRWEELTRENPKFVKDKLANEVPLGTLITPLEIAGAVTFLLSEQARNITGANIIVDGGQSL
jgi:NAD(P)-dependent dehydrogenase (short-subunit alcohol dehydrogenase family)